MTNETDLPPSSPSEASCSETTLTPTTAKIIEKCPRTRILIVGRSGVGKSSLVNAIFKTSFALVQEIRAGETNINREHTSEHNDHFVLHDSQGYEPGDKKKFKILEDFIRERTSPEKPISKRLHAIWLCVPVSFAGGRIFETGDEKIFKLKHGKVPIIFVFTQYDLLFALVRKRNRGGQSLDENKLAKDEFEEKCVKPFQLLTQDIRQNIPFVPVSIHHPDTLQKLVEVTMQNIQPEIAKDEPPISRFKQLSLLNFGAKKVQPVESMNSNNPSTNHTAGDNQCTEAAEDLLDSARVVLAMAQRVDVDTKVAASVEVGKKKYWKAIVSGPNFVNLRLSSCISVIHTDIIMVWNIRGMNPFFLDNMFRGCMTKMVEDLSDLREDKSHATRDAMGAASAAAGIAALIVGPIAGPAAAAAVPVAAVVFLATWAYAMYQKSHDVIRCLMGYTVDLILIMRAVFQASLKDKDGIILEEDVRKIVDKYDKSEAKKDIHNIIRAFVQDQNPFAKSAVVEQIELLIKQDRNFMS